MVSKIIRKVLLNSCVVCDICILTSFSLDALYLRGMANVCYDCGRSSSIMTESFYVDELHRL